VGIEFAEEYGLDHDGKWSAEPCEGSCGRHSYILVYVELLRCAWHIRIRALSLFHDRGAVAKALGCGILGSRCLG